MSDVNMVFVGDAYVGRPDPDSAFTPSLPLLRADVAFCNLETVIADAEYIDPYDKDQHPRTDEYMLASYQKAGFNVMNLANNPSTWHGLRPFVRCLDVLDGAGMVHGGGGRNLAEARRPAIIEKNGTRVAFVCRTSVCNPEYAAGKEQAGIAYYPVTTSYEPRLRVMVVPGSPPIVRTHPDRGEHRDALAEDIKKARAEADFVVVSWHWGVSPATGGSGDLVDYQLEMGHFAIDAGADLIAGHHPHVIQPIEVYKGRPIIYSLGNYCHDMRWGSNSHTGLQAMLVRCLLRDGKLARLAFVPGVINGHGPPDYAMPSELPDVVRHMEQISARFGTRFEAGREDVSVVLS